MDVSNWKCRAKTSWSLGPDREWDGDEAKLRLFEHFGFEGESPDTAIEGCFLISDLDSPDERGSYKLPFCDIVDGGVKAMPAAIRAAATRLPQTEGLDVQEAEKARGVLDGYEAKLRETSETASAMASAAIHWDPVIDPTILGFSIDLFPIDTPSRVSPVMKDHETDLPYVFPADVVARCGCTFQDQPVRVADNLRFHVERKGTQVEQAPIYGQIDHIHTANRQGTNFLVAQGHLWPNQMPEALRKAIMDPEAELGASAEWQHTFEDDEDSRRCVDFRGTGLAILKSKSAAFPDTVFQVAASAAEPLEEAEMNPPKTASKDVEMPEVAAEMDGIETTMAADEQPIVDEPEADQEPSAEEGPFAELPDSIKKLVAEIQIGIISLQATLDTLIPTHKAEEDGWDLELAELEKRAGSKAPFRAYASACAPSPVSPFASAAGETEMPGEYGVLSAEVQEAIRALIDKRNALSDALDREWQRHWAAESMKHAAAQYLLAVISGKEPDGDETEPGIGDGDPDNVSLVDIPEPDVAAEGDEVMAEGEDVLPDMEACDTTKAAEASEQLTPDEKIAQGLPLTAEDLAEVRREAMASAAQQAPDGSLTPDCMASGDVPENDTPLEVTPDFVASVMRSQRLKHEAELAQRMAVDPILWSKKNGSF